MSDQQVDVIYRFVRPIREAAATLLGGFWFVIVAAIWTAVVVGSLLLLSFGLAIGMAYIDASLFLVGGVLGCAVWYVIAAVMLT